MKYRKYIFITAFISMLAFTHSSNAALVEIDFVTPGDNVLTYDTSTNLRWLDVTYFAGTSMQQVESLLSNGGSLQNYRYATESEILQLFANVGIPFINTVYTENVEQQQTVASLISKLGITQIDSAGVTFFTNGLYQAATDNSVVYGAQLAERHPTASSPLIVPGGVAASYSGAGIGFGGIVGYDTGHPNIGHWLVNATVVPLPATMWLLLSGLLPILLLTRRST